MRRADLRMAPYAASDCICGKRMFQVANEGTCAWCGHGLARAVVEFAYARNMRSEVSLVHAKPAPVSAISEANRWTWDQDACATAALAEEARTGRFPSSTRWQEPTVHGEHRPTYRTVIRRFGSWKAFKGYCAEIPREAVAA